MVQMLLFAAVGVTLVGAALILFPRNDGPIETVRGFPDRYHDAASTVTKIGDPAVVVAGMALVSLSLVGFDVLSPIMALGLTLAPIVAIAAVAVVKRTVKLPRPSGGNSSRGYGFPPGHTAGAAAAAGAIVIVSVRAGVLEPWLVSVAATFAFVVAASRVTSGVHYAEDVIAGAGVGLLAAVAALWWI